MLEEDGGDEGGAVVAEDIDEVDVEDGGSEIEEIEVEEIKVADVEEIEDVCGSSNSVGSIPSSPELGDLTDDMSLPPTSDLGEEFADEAEDEVKGMEGRPALKRKHSGETDAEVEVRWKAARRGESVERMVTLLVDESGTETDDKEKRSRSTMVRRELNKFAESGGFDKGKRKQFEERCVEMDDGAEFCYRGARWQVWHSKCMKWYTMSEPYNTTKFRLHLKMCKARSEWGNLPITKFFQPNGAGKIDTEAKKVKITVPSARKQIFVGGCTSTPTIFKPHTHNKIATQSQPCCGISDTHNPLVSTYISQSVVEGAGSVSLQKATRMVFGEGIKYADLNEDQKADVTTTQTHLRSWTITINRELRVVFSTKCAKFVERDRFPKTICGNCETVAESDAFK